MVDRQFSALHLAALYDPLFGRERREDYLLTAGVIASPGSRPEPISGPTRSLTPRAETVPHTGLWKTRKGHAADN